VLFVAYAKLPILVLLGLPLLVAAAVLAISPIALWLGWQMRHDGWADSGKWDSLGFWSVGLVMASGGAEFMAFLFLTLQNNSAI
jgi:hypothetical protein